MKQELIRKFFHMLFGIFFIGLIYYLGTNLSFKIILILFLVGLIIALLHRNGIKIPIFEKIIYYVQREHEKHFPGKAALLFFLAALILLYFFEHQPVVVILALLLQIFPDTIAVLIGKKFGKHIIIKKNHYTKTVSGTLACFITALLISLIFLSPLNALIISIVATIIEFAPINDNLVMPLGVAVVLRFLLI